MSRKKSICHFEDKDGSQCDGICLLNIHFGLLSRTMRTRTLGQQPAVVPTTTKANQVTSFFLKTKLFGYFSLCGYWLLYLFLQKRFGPLFGFCIFRSKVKRNIERELGLRPCASQIFRACLVFKMTDLKIPLLPLLYNKKMMHLRDVFFDCLLLTCILSLINTRCTRALAKFKNITYRHKIHSVCA